MKRMLTAGLFLLPDDPELQRAWATFPDPVMACHGERLEYLGTVFYDIWRHCFRHRRMPGTHQRLYWHVPASEGWTPSMESY